MYSIKRLLKPQYPPRIPAQHQLCRMLILSKGLLNGLIVGVHTQPLRLLLPQRREEGVIRPCSSHISPSYSQLTTKSRNFEDRRTKHDPIRTASLDRAF
jgi:hypothetical protein